MSMKEHLEDVARVWDCLYGTDVEKALLHGMQTDSASEFIEDGS
jgi:hypothetical protein